MELLVQIVDKVPVGHPDWHAAHHVAGDVISCRPDGAGWGREEITNPQFRIIRVPGLTEAEVLSLIAQELKHANAGPSQIMRQRGLHLDLTKLANLAGRRHTDVTDEILDHQHAQHHDFELPLAQVRGAFRVKTAVAAANVIGPSSKVIG